MVRVTTRPTARLARRALDSAFDDALDLVIRRVTVPREGQGNDTLRIDDHHLGNRRAVIVAAWLTASVGEIERDDDLLTFIRKERERDLVAFDETLQRLNLVVGDGNNLEAVLVDVINFAIPSDRLANAGWSPLEGAGEQHNQTAVLLQRYEALHLIGLIGRFELVGNGLPNLRT
jgi:hypothetical protein